MSYHLIKYFALFLPVVILLYQLVPQKFRHIVILLANYTFFFLISGKLIIYMLCSTIFTHYIGLWLENIELSVVGSAKEKTHKKKAVLAFGVWVCLGVLITLKYFNFFGNEIFRLINLFNDDWTFKPVRFLVPIGISFYSLQIISYITDVYRGTQKAEHNLVKVALFLSFFPTIMEGPISKFSEVADTLYEGKRISYKNLTRGYQRIAWGLFKKIVVADRVVASVEYIFSNYETLPGAAILYGAICYTCQLYMEFSGCMDIIIGSGEIFGVELPENFRQPFVAKDASEFWRRWHITLGRFFKDYIFYPVSLAKPVKNTAKRWKKKFGKEVGKFVAPTIALFCVWVSNGLWHGAKWTYIFYGMYYFVIIFVENISETHVENIAKKLHINRQGKIYGAFRVAKLFFIVIIGEMFFRADTLADGFRMFGRIFTNFNFMSWYNHIYSMKMSQNDIFIALIGVVIVTIIGVFHEKGISLRDKIEGWKLPLRWLFWYGVIFSIIIFGAYGSGYTVVDMIYAGY